MVLFAIVLIVLLGVPAWYLGSRPRKRVVKQIPSPSSYSLQVTVPPAFTPQNPLRKVRLNFVRRHPVLTVIAGVVILMFVLSALFSSSDDPSGTTSVQASSPETTKSIPAKKEEDNGIGTESHVRWMDDQMSEYSTCMKKYATKPGFERLAPQILPLLASAQQIHSISHPRYAAAVRSHDQTEAFVQGTFDIFAVTALSSECMFFDDLQNVSETHLRNDTMPDWYKAVSKRLDKADTLLTAYQADSGSQLKYALNAGELQAELNEAMGLKAESEAKLQAGDSVASQILIVHSDLWAQYVGGRLAVWESEVYDKSKPGRP